MKRAYKSKAVWGAVITALPSVWAILSPYLPQEVINAIPNLWQAIMPIGLALGIYGIRDMKEPLGKDTTNNYM